MKKHLLVLASLLLATLVLIGFATVLDRTGLARSGPALAAPAALGVTGVDPAAAPNDLDAPVAITGTDFVSGAEVTLGDTPLTGVAWISATRLEATVPWGRPPGVYTVTVTHPGGGSATLPRAFTVTQGIGVWTAAELYGGDVSEVVVDPQNPDTVYAVAQDVGLFRSDDGGGSWQFKVAGGVYGTRDLAVDPVSPTVLYLYAPYALHRSDDGGDTWTPLDTRGEIPFPHPTQSGTLFASNRREGQSGLWRSDDFGATWVTKTTGLTDTRVNNLVYDPTDPMTIYVGTELGNLFVSNDGGDHWSFVDQPLSYIMSLAINPRGDHELWASNACFDPTPMAIRSTNASHNGWELVPGAVGSMPLTTIAFAPNGWGTTYSETLVVADCWNEVMRSPDGGATWASIDPQTDHANSAVGLHPVDPQILYAGSATQGVHKTLDGGTTWQLATHGLMAVVPDRLAASTHRPDTVYAVTELGLLKGAQGGATWQSLPISDGVTFVATDPVTPDRVYALGSDVGMGQDLPVYVSEDGGATWPVTSYLTEPPRFSTYAHLDPLLVPDPSQAGLLLAGVRHAEITMGGAEAGSLYRSTDAGLSWTEVDVGRPISPVQDIAFDVVSPTIAYMATSGDWSPTGSGLFRSTDGGQTWQPTGGAIAELARAKVIAVEPSAPYRVFVFAGERVYVSPDHGLTWTQTAIHHGAIEGLHSSHDVPHSVLYIATPMGLFRSTDGGGSWGRAAGELGYVPVYALAEAVTADRTVLYAGTTGGAVPVRVGGVPATADAGLLSAGVYRYTTERIVRVYLPLAVRDPN